MPLSRLFQHSGSLTLGLDPLKSRRRTERQRADAQVGVTSSIGEHTVAAVRNVSIHGCNLKTGAEWLRMGRVIGIEIQPARTVQAIVRWSRDGATGVEFLRPLSADDAQRLINP